MPKVSGIEKKGPTHPDIFQASIAQCKTTLDTMQYKANTLPPPAGFWGALSLLPGPPCQSSWPFSFAKLIILWVHSFFLVGRATYNPMACFVHLSPLNGCPAGLKQTPWESGCIKRGSECPRIWNIKHCCQLACVTYTTKAWLLDCWSTSAFISHPHYKWTAGSTTFCE